MTKPTLGKVILPYPSSLRERQNRSADPWKSESVLVLKSEALASLHTTGLPSVWIGVETRRLVLNCRFSQSNLGKKASFSPTRLWFMANLETDVNQPVFFLT